MPTTSRALRIHTLLLGDRISSGELADELAADEVLAGAWAASLYNTNSRIAAGSIRGQRICNLILGEGISAGDLETELAADAFSLAAFEAAFVQRSNRTALLASADAMAIVAGSATAMGVLIADSTALAALVASSTAMTACLADTAARGAFYASDTALTAISASATAKAAMRAAATYAKVSQNTSFMNTPVSITGITGDSLMVGWSTELNQVGDSIWITGRRSGSSIGELGPTSTADIDGTDAEYDNVMAITSPATVECSTGGTYAHYFGIVPV